MEFIKRRILAVPAVYLCWALDQIPAYYEGRWYRHGQLGCRLGLARFWGRWSS